MRSLPEGRHGVEWQLIEIGDVLGLRRRVFLAGRTVLIFPTNVNRKRAGRGLAGTPRDVVGATPIGTSEIIVNSLGKVKGVPQWRTADVCITTVNGFEIGIEIRRLTAS